VSIDIPENKPESKSLSEGLLADSYESVVSPGTLYLVATPIGNLADITRRAAAVLAQVDIIAAEDTRHSQRLLSHLTIKSKLLAYHEHNEDQMTARLLEKLQAGNSIALISDAGTPLISDPGYRLVSQAHDREIKVVPVPGVCAAIAALSAAGLATDSFAFEGFPPAKQGARLNFLEQFSQRKQTLIFYVSCHKIIETLKDMRTVFGASRRVTFAREITKTFETIVRLELSALVDWVEADTNQRKGEIVLIVEGDIGNVTEDTQIDFYLSVLLAELPVKQSVSLVVKLTGENKNDVYKRALELKDA
jgi:16S rRNA (cytidine1402-2'-O)-methyltransferase